MNNRHYTGKTGASIVHRHQPGIVNSKPFDLILDFDFNMCTYMHVGSKGDKFIIYFITYQLCFM